MFYEAMVARVARMATVDMAVKCPKCKAEVGEFCRTPSGKATDTHRARTAEYLASLSEAK